jgi:putative oxidoreductase
MKTGDPTISGQRSFSSLNDMQGFHFLTRDFHRWAPLPLRLIVGYGFMEHGYAKLTHGPQHFAALLHALGVPFPELMAWLTILVELIGGLAVLLGAFVTIASVPMAIMLLTAMFTAHFQYGFSSIKLEAVTAAGAQFGPPGYEVDLLYLACLASLVLGSSGPLALDSFRNKRTTELARRRNDESNPVGTRN